MGICIEFTGRKPRVRLLLPAVALLILMEQLKGVAHERWGGSPPEVVLFDRSVRSERKLPFHFQKFSLPVPLQLVTTVKMADGSHVSVYECSVCKLQKRDVNFLLMHSCTQGSGTAVHLNLFFLPVFVSF